MGFDLSDSANLIEIVPLESRIDHFNFLFTKGIPIQILKTCQLITLPFEREEIYRYHYGIIQNGRFFHDIPFSLEDFILAYLATELHAGVISYDHHLLNMIGHYLDYEAFWPEDVVHFNDSHTFLLDCNILIEFQAQKSDHRSAIESMFRENHHDFLIPEVILAEYRNLTQFNKRNLRMKPKPKQNNNNKLKSSGNPHLFPEDIDQFIEDYEHFEPKRFRKEREREKMEFRENMKLNPQLEYKDFVAKRYKGLAKQIVFDEHYK